MRAYLNRDVRRTTDGPGISSRLRPGTICATMSTSTRGRLDVMKGIGFTQISSWHNGAHGHFGGTFTNFNDAAQVPLFWVWHVAVDTVWANLERCYLDDGASL